MKHPVIGCAILVLLGCASVDSALAQSAAEARRAGGIVSVPVSRRTSTRPVPYGTETTVDEQSYSVVPYNWQGFYIGLHAGGAWGHARSSNAAPFGGYDAGVPAAYGVSPFGFAGGAQFGWLWQTGNWVYGGEVDVGYLGLDRDVTVGDDRAAVRYGWYSTLTGRIGFAWNHALWYLKGGAAAARIRNTATDLDGAPPAVDPADITQVTKTRFGWVLGGGLEYAVAPQWSVKAEYLYLDFGTASSVNLAGDVFRHRNTVQVFKLGANYHFGGVPLFIRW